MAGSSATVESDDPGNLTDEPHGTVVVRDASGKIVAHYDPCTQCRYSGLAWSPKGDALVFLAADDKAGKTTLYRVAAGKPQALTVIAGVANTPLFSSDGARIALLATLGAHKKTGAIEAAAPQVGEIGANADEQRIAVLPASGGALKLVSPADTYVYEYSWTPDGKGFAATTAKGNGDNNWWIATLRLYRCRQRRPPRHRQPQDADGHAPGFAGRQKRRLHRRLDERLGFGRRRCLYRAAFRRRARRCHAQLQGHLRRPGLAR